MGEVGVDFHGPTDPWVKMGKLDVERDGVQCRPPLPHQAKVALGRRLGLSVEVVFGSAEFFPQE